MAGKIRLGELLVRAGVLDELKLKAALAEQQRWGGRLGRILIDMNFVSEDLLTKALSKQLGFPRATFSEVNIPSSVLAKVPADFARSNACCPEHFDAPRKLLTVAMADPTNVPVADELRFKTGLRVEPTIAGEIQISMAIDHLYGTRSGSYSVQLPDAIDLPPDDDKPVFAPSQAYIAAMAASGLTIESGATAAPGGPRPPAPGPQTAVVAGAPITAGAPVAAAVSVSAGAPIASGAPPPYPASAPAQSTGPLELNMNAGTLEAARPSNGYHHLPAPQTTTGPLSGSLGVGRVTGPLDATGDGVARRLEAAQRQQHRAVLVMIDLLIEKGVFTREEFAQWIKRRGH